MDLISVDEIELPERIGKNGTLVAVEFGPPTQSTSHWFSLLVSPYADWALNPPVKGSQYRSSADYGLISQLVRLGASDGDILDFYDEFPIGTDPASKVQEKGSHALEYLRLTISKARGEYAETQNRTEEVAAEVGSPAVKIDGYLLSLPLDDEGHAQCFRYKHEHEYVYVGAWGWLRWTGTHWERENAEAHIDRAIMAILDARLVALKAAGFDKIKLKRQSNTVAAVRRVLQSTLGRDLSPEDFDPCEKLNVANGVVDLRTGELSPHGPEWRFTYTLATPYDPSASQTTWRAFIASSLHNSQRKIAGGVLRELAEYLQMAMGYVLAGAVSEGCFWWIYGPTRSGKGTFTETLMAAIGKPLAVEVDFMTFTQRKHADTNNFDLAALRPARFVFASEVDDFDKVDTRRMKAMTGGNDIRCSFKGKDLFTYSPRFTPVLSANKPPRADPDDMAFWRSRARVIEFPNSHVGKEDKTLKARLREPEALAGVLAWLVEGAVKWYAAPTGLVTPECVETITEEHRANLDVVGQWIEERVEIVEGAAFPAGEAYTLYRAWCLHEGHTPKGQVAWTRSMEERGFPRGRPSTPDGQVRVLFNVASVNAKPGYILLRTKGERQ